MSLSPFPVEPKVKVGAGGATLGGLIDLALVDYLFPHISDPTGKALILAAVPGVLSFIGGWLARHMYRPKPAPAAPVLPSSPGLQGPPTA